MVMNISATQKYIFAPQSKNTWWSKTRWEEVQKFSIRQIFLDRRFRFCTWLEMVVHGTFFKDWRTVQKLYTQFLRSGKFLISDCEALALISLQPPHLSLLASSGELSVKVKPSTADQVPPPIAMDAQASRAARNNEMPCKAEWKPLVRYHSAHICFATCLSLRACHLNAAAPCR
jgi:hypothetical protein